MLALLRVAPLLPSPTLRAAANDRQVGTGKQAQSIELESKVRQGPAWFPPGCIFTPASQCVFSPALTRLPTTARSSRPETRAGASRTAPELVHPQGPTPIRGPVCAPFDS